MSWFSKIIHVGYTLAHVAKDGRVTPDEIIDILQAVFPDQMDAALEQVRSDLEDDGKLNVDDVLRIVTAIV